MPAGLLSSKITVVLLNWKRPENLLRLLDSLYTQTERPTVFLWDNNPRLDDALHRTGWTLDKVDWYIASSKNRFCPPRWWMAQQATTPYVMTCDDDLMPGDDRLIEDIVQVLDRYKNQNLILGAFGKVLVPGIDYEHCPAAEYEQACDIILGRMMCLHTESLRKRLLWPPLVSWNTVDDIVVSSLLANGVPHSHFCSAVFRNRLVELPDHDALCYEEGHFVRREGARKRWFNR